MLVADEWESPWHQGPPWFPTTVWTEPDQPDLELAERLAAVLAQLPERHLAVLQRRIGLAGHEASTLQRIGTEFGVTRERIRQIESKAMIRLAARARRLGAVPGSSERELANWLDDRFREAPRRTRATVLNATFPNARPEPLARVLSLFAPATTEQLAELIRLPWREAEAQRRADETDAKRQRVQERHDDRFRVILGSVFWPGTVARMENFPLRPQRSVNEDGGCFSSARLGRDVQYESGLELLILSTIERATDVRSYCEQPVRIPYLWQGATRTYVPDIAVQLADRRVAVIEAKPRLLWAEPQNLAKWSAASLWCAVRGWGFGVTDGRIPCSCLIADVAEGDADLALDMTRAGPANWSAVQARWFDSGRTWTQLLSTALAQGLSIERGPFRLGQAGHHAWFRVLRTGVLQSG